MIVHILFNILWTAVWYAWHERGSIRRLSSRSSIMLGPATDVHVTDVMINTTYLHIVVFQVYFFVETVFPNGKALFQKHNAHVHPKCFSDGLIKMKAEVLTWSPDFPTSLEMCHWSTPLRRHAKAAQLQRQCLAAFVDPHSIRQMVLTCWLIISVEWCVYFCQLPPNKV